MFNEWTGTEKSSLDQNTHAHSTNTWNRITWYILRQTKHGSKNGFCAAAASQSGYSKTDSTHFKHNHAINKNQILTPCTQCTQAWTKRLASNRLSMWRENVQNDLAFTVGIINLWESTMLWLAFFLLFQRKENTVGMLWQNEDVRAHQTQWLHGWIRIFNYPFGKIVYCQSWFSIKYRLCVCAVAHCFWCALAIVSAFD